MIDFEWAELPRIGCRIGDRVAILQCQPGGRFTARVARYPICAPAGFIPEIEDIEFNLPSMDAAKAWVEGWIVDREGSAHDKIALERRRADAGGAA